MCITFKDYSGIHLWKYKMGITFVGDYEGNNSLRIV